MIRRVFTSQPADFAAAPGEVLQAKGVRAVMLDPHFCPPGLRVAVTSDGNGTPQVIGAGDLAVFPKGSGATFRAYDARGWLGSSPFVQLNLARRNVIGPVGILCSDDPNELLALSMGRHNRGPTGAMATVGVLRGAGALQAQAVTIVPSNYMVADGLTGMRITALPFDSADTELAVAPADFAATVQLWSWIGFRDAARNFRGIREVVPRGDNQGAIGTYITPAWAPNGEANLAADQLGYTFDRSVIAASFAFGFTCTALAGTGVTHLGLVVEGY